MNIKKNLVSSLSRVALIGALAAPTLTATSSVFAADGLLDNTSSAQTSQSSSASSDASSTSSSASSDASSDASSSSASDASSDADSSSASDTSSDASDASSDADSASASTADVPSSDSASYPASSSASQIPQTGMKENVAKAGAIAGAVGLAGVAAAGVAYKRRHADDGNIR